MSGERAAGLPIGIDTSVPSAARVYDACLGGKDHYEVDREALRMGLEHAPELVNLAHENRAYLKRAVTWVSEHTGIDQFLDVGSGLPTVENTHQIAQGHNPDARVVYVDSDPIVLAHGEAILAENANTTVIAGDLAQPETYLDDSETLRLLDLSRPVCLMLVSVLHCLPDDADPFGALARVIDRLAPGSCLVYSHIASDSEEKGKVVTELAQNLRMPWGRVRLLEEADRAMDGLEIVAPDLEGAAEPRLVECTTWKNFAKPAPEPVPSGADRQVWEYAGVGIKH
ncbi:SAM-dependent methyltransferase [Lipingzhangella halophila]|uniref:SAM-dependent methyltransferase n=1 Tax=Lipingzhangella halophila TaxID=1783352 RepID=A0A7W7RI79_9ACTN|nr:SAM-dependent methyltransferase [Lipingzhangella halophila]MBB4932375.1 SAM-dependent methyltransferase [Lipingzhangella halophila]